MPQRSFLKANNIKMFIIHTLEISDQCSMLRNQDSSKGDEEASEGVELLLNDQLRQIAMLNEQCSFKSAIIHFGAPYWSID